MKKIIKRTLGQFPDNVWSNWSKEVHSVSSTRHMFDHYIEYMPYYGAIEICHNEICDSDGYDAWFLMYEEDWIMFPLRWS